MKNVTGAGGLLVDQYTFNWAPFGNGKGIGKGSAALAGHFMGKVGTAHYGCCRGGKETLVQHLKLIGLSVIPNGGAGQPLQLLSKGEQQCGAGEVEYSMDYSYTCLVGAIVNKGKVKYAVCNIEEYQQHDCADDVEVKVNHGRTAGALGCAHRG